LFPFDVYHFTNRGKYNNNAVFVGVIDIHGSHFFIYSLTEGINDTEGTQMKNININIDNARKNRAISIKIHVHDLIKSRLYSAYVWYIISIFCIILKKKLKQ